MMFRRDELDILKQELHEELLHNILPYWSGKMVDEARGGFYGRRDGHDVLVADAPKGAVLNARILWTFSAAYRLLGRDEDLAMATRAKEYFLRYFIDKEYGGVYWSLTADGMPLETKKQIYALGFAIYGLSEYFRATQDEEALECAIALYKAIEKHSFDGQNNGYYEALTRDWQPIADMRLSEKDENASKTMNTHLHILEPYTNLYRVWQDEELGEKIENLIGLFTDKIYDPTTGHLGLFFNDEWVSTQAGYSYGHDIEASWLIHEAALVLGKSELIEKVEPVVKALAKAANEGLQADGSLVYETSLQGGHTDTDRHWWVQAECVVGNLNIFQYFNDEQALENALMAWRFVQTHLVDKAHGEWFWSVNAAYRANLTDDKAGFWKCPYHNSRMCLEVLERF